MLCQNFPLNIPLLDALYAFILGHYFFADVHVYVTNSGTNSRPTSFQGECMKHILLRMNAFTGYVPFDQLGYIYIIYNSFRSSAPVRYIVPGFRVGA